MHKRCGRGRKGENPREMKTQERIGSGRPGNTGRVDARTLAKLKPLKSSPFDQGFRLSSVIPGWGAGPVKLR